MERSVTFVMKDLDRQLEGPPSDQESLASTARDENMAGEGAADQGGSVSLMQQLLDDPSHDYRSLKYGDVLDGTIMQRDRDEFLIDIGSKSEGIIPSKEYSTLTTEDAQRLKVGDKVLVFVVQPENADGHTVLSIDKARQEKSWRQLQEQYDKNEVIQAQVTNYNKGGLLVNLDGVRGFVPASQVTEIRGGDDASKQADMARLIGSPISLKVIEINRHRNRLILSERMAVQERRDAMKERLIENLHEGETRSGRISSIADFGAFVDIGGADGLVHLSEISWSRVKHPSEVLKVGEEVQVFVLSVNPREKKIALSIKRTQPEPWSRVADRYEIGQVVAATITQLANFGAFARIEDGIEGLIHVSELSDERVNHPREVVQEGQEVPVRIIRIDPQRRRMGLSLRRAVEGGPETSFLLDDANPAPWTAPRAPESSVDASVFSAGAAGGLAAAQSGARSGGEGRPDDSASNVDVPPPASGTAGGHDGGTTGPGDDQTQTSVDANQPASESDHAPTHDTETDSVASEPVELGGYGMTPERAGDEPATAEEADASTEASESEPATKANGA